MDSNTPAPTVQKITKKDGKSIAYSYRAGKVDAPTLLFLCGYRSDMTGTKASFLDKLCAEQGISYLRFDYTGHGQSDGDFSALVFSDWVEDALLVLDTLVRGDVVLVGSSMGGWIGLLIGKLRSDRIKAFIGIAAAPDFTDWVWNHHMSEADRALCRRQGYIDTPDGDTLSLQLFEDGANHLVLDKTLYLPFPVTLLQGKQDASVPYAVAERLAAHITPNPAKLILIEDGDHRLTREEDLEILKKLVLKQLS